MIGYLITKCHSERNEERVKWRISSNFNWDSSYVRM